MIQRDRHVPILLVVTSVAAAMASVHLVSVGPVKVFVMF